MGAVRLSMLKEKFHKNKNITIGKSVKKGGVVPIFMKNRVVEVPQINQRKRIFQHPVKIKQAKIMAIVTSSRCSLYKAV